MFKWLRDKVMKGTEESFNKGLDRNTNFLEFAKSFSNNTPEVNDIIYALETDNTMLWTVGYNDKSMSKLLDVDMNLNNDISYPLSVLSSISLSVKFSISEIYLSLKSGPLFAKKSYN